MHLSAGSMPQMPGVQCLSRKNSVFFLLIHDDGGHARCASACGGRTWDRVSSATQTAPNTTIAAAVRKPWRSAVSREAPAATFWPVTVRISEMPRVRPNCCLLRRRKLRLSGGNSVTDHPYPWSCHETVNPAFPGGSILMTVVISHELVFK